MKRESKRQGFTIIELVITMTVSSIIILSMVGTVTFLITSTAVLGTRNGLPGDLQAGLQRIAGTIRNSDNVLLYNLAPDDNAPIIKAGEAANVLGPPEVPADDNYRYFWRSTTHQLVLAQPSRDTNDSPIYNDPINGDFTGPRDSIVLYIKDKALYQRSVYDAQSATDTSTCAGSTETGGCNSDIKLVDNIKLVSGVPQLNITYLDVAGVPIPATLANGTNNYQARKLTRAIKIDLTLESMQGTQAITAHDTSTISFRTGDITSMAEIPGLVIGTGSGSAPAYSLNRIVVGPGGLAVGYNSRIRGSILNVQGRITMNESSRIGAPSTPTTVTAGKLSCGTPPHWPSLCSGEPITGLWSPSSYNGGIIYGNVCATGQVTATGMSNPGLQPGCTPPPVTMPTYSRQTFINSMKSQQPSSNGSCSWLNFSPKTLGPDVTYTGSLTSDNVFCIQRIKGNIYVMGNFILSQFNQIIVDESVGTKRPIVVVDGNISFDLGTTVIPNSYGATVDFISFGSSNANCLTTPACSDRTDLSLLHNSHNKPTISLTGSLVPGSTFYSYYGAVNVTYDGANVGAVAGQTVTLNGYTTVTGP
jgi:prepilin-type N-terminal cleavage/methylation domain-containing protein